MKKYNEILQRSPLFDGIRMDDLAAMLCCIGGHTVTAAKGQPIFQEGDPATHVGMVLSGAVRMIREDYYGNRSIVAHIEPSELFGESYACAGISSLPVSIVADEDSTILLMDCRRITTTCCNACEFHNRIIFNLLKLVATKNLVFDQKIQVTSKRTTREKLMAYLLTQAKIQGSSSFLIPYDRQELADYLEVDRSGLSAQISKLRREGILESKKNRFTLLD
ncbi:MAG: Crp/Fnr family transcriptional regulator [Oscillospiraceae bacterium]|nr:Crp/Fnr family transcriptional regulator [Oscillospiraceae bacterium]